MRRYLAYLATPYSIDTDAQGSLSVRQDTHIREGLGHGINHAVGNLSALIGEAAMLGRIPLLLPPILTETHNLGYRIEPSWRNYVDLDNIRIDIEYSGIASVFCNNRVINGSGFEYIDCDSFRQLSFRADEAATVPSHRRISLQQNRDCRLIIRHDKCNREWHSWNVKWPRYQWVKVRRKKCFGYALNRQWLKYCMVSLAKLFHYCYWSTVSVSLPRAPDIRETARRVRAVLGDKYYAVHIRRGDCAVKFPAIDKATTSEAIVARLGRLLPDGVVIYLMSDERQPHYFDLLKRYYKVYRYSDFPELAAYINGVPPDNHKLFMIESELRDGAHGIVETIRNNLPPPRLKKTRAAEAEIRYQAKVMYLMDGIRDLLPQRCT